LLIVLQIDVQLALAKGPENRLDHAVRQIVRSHTHLQRLRHVSLGQAYKSRDIRNERLTDFLLVFFHIDISNNKGGGPVSIDVDPAGEDSS
jgi:hypothetical protein